MDNFGGRRTLARAIAESFQLKLDMHGARYIKLSFVLFAFYDVSKALVICRLCFNTDLFYFHQGAGVSDGSVVKCDRGVQVRLHEYHIWQSFAACGSKMVIGRDFGRFVCNRVNQCSSFYKLL